jgi:hypothetical protein
MERDPLTAFHAAQCNQSPSQLQSSLQPKKVAVLNAPAGHPMDPHEMR